MIGCEDIKKGVAIRMDGYIWVCIDFQHIKPGKATPLCVVNSRTLLTDEYSSVHGT